MSPFYRLGVAPSRLASQIGRVVADRYRLTAPLGAGASAEVYLATDVRLDRQVAVKILQPALAADNQFLERFRTEARTVAGISHPNVVVVHDWGEGDGEVPYLVTEYLAGGSLRAVLAAGSRLSPSQALVIGLDVCRGLAHAHGLGLVHRDLKPANLLFDPEGRLRIADFGLARAIAEASITEEIGTMVGTARYAAPEQARGMRVDGKADIYSLAVLLVEAVTGQIPFAADTAVATLMARTESDLPVPDALGPLRPAIERAGRLDPEARPDAEEFGLALLAASERLTAPKPLPLVGALTEAETTSAPSELTQTMRAPVTGDAAAAGAASGLANGHAPAATTKPDESAGAIPPGAPPTEPIAPVPTPAADGDGPPEGKKRRRWRYVLAAVALIAMGAGGYFAFQTLRTPSYTVPDVAGEQLADIQLIADQNDWVIDKGENRMNGTVPGEIISTDPEAGESLEEGGTLKVIVSLGNELTDVPTGLEGKKLEEVQKAFADVGLAVKATPQHHEEIPADSVIGFAEAPPERLPRETEVELLVSAGPEPRTVPQVGNGMTFDQYAAKLAEVQLKAKRIDEFSESVSKSVVISLGTDPGTEVPRDSEIEVVVSKGPERVKVPDVIGMDVKNARKEIEKAGLKVGNATKNQGVVVAMDPREGKMVKPGTEVDLLVRGS